MTYDEAVQILSKRYDAAEPGDRGAYPNLEVEGRAERLKGM